MNDELASEARRLRVEGLSVAQIQARLGVTKHSLTSWLAGIPAAAWTRRPNAKDELRARAETLRADGWSVNDIALELGVARSTAWLWVKHLPLDPDTERARRKAEHSKVMTDARWERHRQERDADRAAIHDEAAAQVGELSERDLLLIGAVAYWCEGSKSKPWRRLERVIFTNSDPALIAVFLRFLSVCEVPADTIFYRVAIHASHDPGVAEEWWAEQLGLGRDRFRSPTIKRHRATNRHNRGVDYHGCLVVEVQRGRRLYWRVEGLFGALATGVADRRFRLRHVRR